MKKIKDKGYDVGVIIGRFQTDELHKGHVELIDWVVNNHKHTIVYLGLSPCKCTIHNPLDFETRKAMLLERYPDIKVYYLFDTYSDNLWSRDLDENIDRITGPNQSVCLYGSRDSFIPYYSGMYPTQELEQAVYLSATEIRKQLAQHYKGTADFRHGVIWATHNQYPKCFPTIDVAIFNDPGDEILLGKKIKEDKWRFIGGFVMPGQTLEETVHREALEEAGVTLSNLEYVGSFVIDDWRYRSEADKITSCLFTAIKQVGTPNPGDDIAKLQWFSFDEHILPEVIDAHKDMMKKLLGMDVQPKAEKCECVPVALVAGDTKL
jgi:bifunctional NMN adenylyltransferase/nudix hydrolase